MALAQPAISEPRTPTPITASTKNTPASRTWPTAPSLGPMGMARRTRRYGSRATAGASWKTRRSAPAGTTSSFCANFTPSAMSWAQPWKPPAYIGPSRPCMWAITLCSGALADDQREGEEDDEDDHESQGDVQRAVHRGPPAESSGVVPPAAAVWLAEPSEAERVRRTGRSPPRGPPPPWPGGSGRVGAGPSGGPTRWGRGRRGAASDGVSGRRVRTRRVPSRPATPWRRGRRGRSPCGGGGPRRSRGGGGAPAPGGPRRRRRTSRGSRAHAQRHRRRRRRRRGGPGRRAARSCGRGAGGPGAGRRRARRPGSRCPARRPRSASRSRCRTGWYGPSPGR
ncbi:hypothetical protein SCANM63S_09455 [Streptomyces canarius]